jgi:DNA-binding CsgD family transcriptional regulator
VGFISHSQLDSWAEAMLLELLPWAGMHLEAGLMHSGVSEMLALRSLSHSERKSRLEEGFGSLPGASWLVHQSTGQVELATADGAASLAAEPRLSTAIARVAQDARFAEDAGRAGLTLAFQSAPYALVTRAGRARARAARDKSTLTNRQREVLALVLKGNSNRQIAETLGCSRRTAEHHVAAILAKTGQPTRAALVATLWEGDDGRAAPDERAPAASKTQTLPD